MRRSTDMSTAAVAGPTSAAAPSTVPTTTLAAVSWTGPSTTDGSRTDWLGRVALTAVAASTAPA